MKKNLCQIKRLTSNFQNVKKKFIESSVDKVGSTLDTDEEKISELVYLNKLT